jgi:hypothetical protein
MPQLKPSLARESSYPPGCAFLVQFPEVAADRGELSPRVQHVASGQLRPRVHRDLDRVPDRVPGLTREPGLLDHLVPTRIVARRKSSLIFLTLDEVWAIEAANRLAFVHTRRSAASIWI